MSEANSLLGVSPTSFQPHLNPTLATMGRITPTLGNLKGYPPYELTKVLGYTNHQILYYIRGG
jgi:hypothetical protein